MCIWSDTVNVKSFNFVGTKFCGLTSIDKCVDNLIHGFQIILNIINVNEYFFGILNFFFIQPTKYKFNVQRIEMTLQYMSSKLGNTMLYH